MKMEKEKLYDFTDKIVECFQHKNAIKQVYDIQETIKEIWNDGIIQNKCECTEFQSCEKCAKKTEWKDPLLFPPDSPEEYWILDTRNNSIKEGIHHKKGIFKYRDGSMIYFEHSMYAEIKPPEVPG
jgi:hypothetical protein